MILVYPCYVDGNNHPIDGYKITIADINYTGIIVIKHSGV